ncbi:hypothetical protein CDAR_498211 [Caerostris darwini]|uniref:Uncharacterized protein n=1 Tax=Caerostris darwini TaxID=1538125 RepID=A0AAV4U002_9ARAC|nr:hypothetical protein CDAR_498211 [Caerostris darwini]
MDEHVENEVATGHPSPRPPSIVSGRQDGKATRTRKWSRWAVDSRNCLMFVRLPDLEPHRCSRSAKVTRAVIRRQV